MLLFSEKRAHQRTIVEQNKILSNSPSFTAKRNAQKTKLEAMAKLGMVAKAVAGNQENIDPKSLITTPNGSIDFGDIDPDIALAIGREPAKIRLRYGDDKQGLLHIEKRHKADIEALGFNSVTEFIYEITKNFTSIYKSDRANSRSLILVENRGRLKFAGIQLEPSDDGAFYEIKNATPGREGQFSNKSPLWERTGPSASSESEDQTFLLPEAKDGLDKIVDRNFIIDNSNYVRTPDTDYLDST